jgi:putative transposase
MLMTCEPDSNAQPSNLPTRQSIRLKSHDYSQAGAYFITVCTDDKQKIFGSVVNNEVQLNTFGLIVAEEWEMTGQLRGNVSLDTYIIMPNHFHAVLFLGDQEKNLTKNEQSLSSAQVIDSDSALHAGRFNPNPSVYGRPTRGSLSTIVGSFKSAATKRINRMRGTPGGVIWQRGFYERIIRSDEALYRIRKYIQDNPRRWSFVDR